MGKHKRRSGGRITQHQKTNMPFFAPLGDTIIPIDLSTQRADELQKSVKALDNYIARLSSHSCMDEETNHWIAHARLHRGVALSLLGVWQTALEDLTQVIEHEQGTAEAHTASLFLALAYDIGANQDRQAMEVWNHLLEALEPLMDQACNPASSALVAQAYVSRARLSARKDEYTQTISDCNRALELDPTCAEAYSLRGAAYGHLGQVDLAETDCSQAIELAGWPAHYYRRALVYKRKGNYQLAFDDLKQARQMEPDNQLFRQEQMAVLMYWIGNPRPFSSSIPS